MIFNNNLLIIIFIIFIYGVNSYPLHHKITKLPDQPKVVFQQYAGYVNVESERALFYYFVEAKNQSDFKPLVLWLNGDWLTWGGGCSSIGYGAFIEHGPFRATEHGLIENKYSWNNEANMLYLDSPAGVGFSFSSNTSFYNNVDDQMTAQDNLVFLERWLDLFPEYKGRDLLITGENYGGHYVPQLAQLIQKSSLQINLKGVAIGNPLMDFEINYNARGDFFWSHSMISDETYEILQTNCNYSTIMRQSLINHFFLNCGIVLTRLKIEIGPWLNTYDVTLDVCLSWNDSQSSLSNNSGTSQPIDLCQDDRTTIYMNRKDVQQALHARLVGINEWSLCSRDLHYDIQSVETSTTGILGSLIKSGIRVLVFSGDQDSSVPTIGTRKLIKELAQKLNLNTTVPYQTWAQGKQVGGWTQVYGDTLVLVVVRGAGLQAAQTQPERLFSIFQNFVNWKNLSLVN